MKTLRKIRYLFPLLFGMILAICGIAQYYEYYWVEITGGTVLIILSIHLGYQFDRVRYYEFESKKQTARMSALVRCLNSGILAVDENRTIIHVNEEFCRLFHLENGKQLHGTNGHDLFKRVMPLFDDPNVFLARIRGLYTANKMVLSQEVLLTNGQVYELDYLPIYVDEHDSGHLWHYRDVTETKRKERLLIESNILLKNLSALDGLTGIANRRTFDSRISAEWQRTMRQNSGPISLIMLDLDHFKFYNDTYGHQEGDTCLKQIASTVQAGCIRSGDLAARYGGEEFAIILPATSQNGAFIVAEKIKRTIDNLKIPHTGSLVSNHVTISIGISTVVPDAVESVHAFIEQADKALYHAKAQGRNQIAFYEEINKKAIHL